MTDDFFTLHRDLPREGPGEAADVLWAIGTAGVNGAVRVLDAGCGPGADLVTLADTLPEARIEGVDLVPSFVEAAAGRVARHVGRVTVRRGEMATVTGPYDLIWSAAAAYFLGVGEILDKWRKVLAPGGRIAFSEAVWLRDDPPQVLSDFWQDYPAMTDLGGLCGRIAAADYRILGSRLLSEAAWDAYYAPMAARIADLRKGPVGPELAQVLDDAETEIALRRQYPGYYGYALVVVAPR